MKIVDKLFKQYKDSLDIYKNTNSYLAARMALENYQTDSDEKGFKAGYQAVINRIIFLRHLEAIDGHCSKILLDDLQREEE